MAGGAHGGAETAFVDMCIAQHEAGQEIEVVTRPNPIRVPQLRKAGITVHMLPFGGAIDIYTPHKIAAIIRKFKPAIVQTWMSRAPAKLPSWNTAKGPKPYRVLARLGGYYKIKYFKNADYFATITPDIKRHLVEHGIAAERVRHINNFAETEEAPVPVNRADTDTPEDAKVLLTLGRLHRAKAFDTLIRTVAEIPDAYLWIAGEGPDRAELEALIAALNVQQRVKLLGWREDRAALFQAADICVFPSRYEPFGTVFVQAWAQGVPLVTTAAAGPMQFIRDEEDALVVPIDDVPALKVAIERVMHDEELAIKLVANGTQRYLGEFTKEGMLKAYSDFYRDIAVQEGLSDVKMAVKSA